MKIPLANYNPDASFIIHFHGDSNIFYHFNPVNQLEKIRLSNGSSSVTKVYVPDSIILWQLKKKDVMLDKINPNILWIKGYNHLYTFDRSNDQFGMTSVPKCNHVDILTNYILANTDSYGLILFDKYLNVVDSLAKFRHTMGSGIFESDGIGLIMNGELYLPKENKFEKIRKINGIGLDAGELNYVFKKDSFYFYRPGRYVSKLNIIVGKNHYLLGIVEGENHLYSYPLFYNWSDRTIFRYNLKNRDSKKIELKLPHENGRNVIYDGSLFWSISSDRMFSISSTLDTFCTYPVHFDDRNSQAFWDEKNLYILADGNLTIINKVYLASIKQTFDDSWYINEMQRYHIYMGRAVSLSDITSLDSLLDYINKIDLEFADLIHFSDTYETRTHYAFDWRFQDTLFLNSFLEYMLNHDIKNEKLLNLIPSAISYVVTNKELNRALNLDSIFRRKYGNLFLTHSYLSPESYDVGLERVKRFKNDLDSLENYSATIDEFEYKKAIKYLDLCNIGWYGDMTCDANGVGVELLSKFLKKYPKSQLWGDAKWELIQHFYFRNEHGTFENVDDAEKDYKELFLSVPKNKIFYSALRNFADLYDFKYKDRAYDEFNKFITKLEKSRPALLKEERFNQIVSDIKKSF